MLTKLDVFETEVEARGPIRAELSEKLLAAEVKRIPKLGPGNTSVNAQYTIEVNNRAAVQATLKEQSIPTAVHYPILLCQQPALTNRGSCTRCCQLNCDCPVAQAASERVLSLPMHPYLNSDERHKIVAAVAEAVASANLQSL